MAKRTIDAKVRKVGHSYIITIPMKIVEKFKIRKGDTIEVNLNI